jgi:phospholipid/cholesterol/gamma-HCH transport system substrate-binding protein
MSREFKIGLLTILVLVTMIWGYTFLKGRNLLTTANELVTTYSDVTELNVSSPVFVNGFKVGTVTKIKLNPNDVKKMDVYYLIDGDYFIPKNAIAELKSAGVMDGKAIFLKFDKPCTGADCAVTGDELKGATFGLIGSLLDAGEVSAYSSELTESARAIIGNIGKEGEPGSINETVRQLEIITKNLAILTQNSNQLILNSQSGLKKTIDNMAVLSASLAKSNTKIESMIANLDKVTGDVAKSNLSNTVAKTNDVMDASKATITELKTTLSDASKTMTSLKTTIDQINTGEGSMGKLMSDKQLYTNMEATTRNLNLLLQDLRLNPKRYAHFSLFGKKQKEFTKPEDDPALVPDQK